jgi:hypothetical protein
MSNIKKIIPSPYRNDECIVYYESGAETNLTWDQIDHFFLERRVERIEKALKECSIRIGEETLKITKDLT